MPTFRYATAADAPLITRQRHLMFADNKLATEERYAEMDLQFEPWVRERLSDGRYLGLFYQHDSHQQDSHQPDSHQPDSHQPDSGEDPGTVIAASGVFLGDFPPHYLDPSPIRAYLLNFYTAPEARGQGLARKLLAQSVEECRARNVKVVTLHASPFGRPIYEAFGFTQNNELILKP